MMSLRFALSVGKGLAFINILLILQVGFVHFYDCEHVLMCILANVNNTAVLTPFPLFLLYLSTFVTAGAIVAASNSEGSF